MNVVVRRATELTTLLREFRRFDPDILLYPPTGDGQTASLAAKLAEISSYCQQVLIVPPGHEGAAARPAACHAVLPLDADGVGLRSLVRQIIDSRPEVASVLVVEDTFINLEMVAEMLHNHGYRVLRAMTAEEGFEIVHQIEPHAILMDVHLPGMSGIEAVRRLKSKPETEVIPVVMLSANGDDDAISRCLEAGAIDFMAKPFRPDQLVEKLAHVIAKRDLLAHA